VHLNKYRAALWLQEEQEIATLVVIMQHLHGARFQSFWMAVDACVWTSPP